MVILSMHDVINKISKTKINVSFWLIEMVIRNVEWQTTQHTSIK